MKEKIVLRIARPSFIPEGKYLKHGRGQNMPLWKDCETEDFYLSFGDWKSKVNNIIQSYAVNPVAPFKEFIEAKTGVKDNPFSTSHVIEPPAAHELIKEYATAPTTHAKKLESTQGVARPFHPSARGTKKRGVGNTPLLKYTPQKPTEQQRHDTGEHHIWQK